MKNNLLSEVLRIKAMMGLTEDLNLADKLYFKNGLLNSEVRDAIISITHGDNFTKLVTDLYYHFNTNNQKTGSHGLDSGILKLATYFYKLLKDYDKKLFPVRGNLTDYNANDHNDFHVITLYELLDNRAKLVNVWVLLPGIVRRNLAPLISEMLNNPNRPNHVITYAYKKATETVGEIVDILKTISDKKQAELLPKLFSSNKTFDEITKAFENLRQTLSFISQDGEINPDSIVDSIHDYDLAADVIIDNGKILIIKVKDADAMQRLGCYSAWCFSIPGGELYWDEYAPLGYVYIIYDFKIDIDDARFLMVYLPDSGSLYMSNNIPYVDVHQGESNVYLRSIGVEPNKLK